MYDTPCRTVPGCGVVAVVGAEESVTAGVVVVAGEKGDRVSSVGQISGFQADDQRDVGERRNDKRRYRVPRQKLERS